MSAGAIQAGYRRKQSDYDRWLQLTRKLVDSGTHTLVDLLGRAAMEMGDGLFVRYKLITNVNTCSLHVVQGRDRLPTSSVGQICRHLSRPSLTLSS